MTQQSQLSVSYTQLVSHFPVFKGLLCITTVQLHTIGVTVITQLVYYPLRFCTQLVYYPLKFAHNKCHRYLASPVITGLKAPPNRSF